MPRVPPTVTANMRRVNCFITHTQDRALKHLSEKTGLGMSELIRRSIDTYLGRTDLAQRRGGVTVDEPVMPASPYPPPPNMAQAPEPEPPPADGPAPQTDDTADLDAWLFGHKPGRKSP